MIPPQLTQPPPSMWMPSSPPPVPTAPSREHAPHLANTLTPHRGHRESIHAPAPCTTLLNPTWQLLVQTEQGSIPRLWAVSVPSCFLGIHLNTDCGSRLQSLSVSPQEQWALLRPRALKAVTLTLSHYLRWGILTLCDQIRTMGLVCSAYQQTHSVSGHSFIMLTALSFLLSGP